MEFTNLIETFFKDPIKLPNKEGDGILYNLRRDLSKLYGQEDSFRQDPSDNAMLATIGMLIGLDYLSNVYSSEQHSGDRFVQTIKDLLLVSSDESEALYQFRNALAHSFSLSTVSQRAKFRKGDELFFQLTDKETAPLIKLLSYNESTVTYEVNFWELKRCFLQVITKLKDICDDPGHPKHKYVLNKVGELHSEKLLKQG